MKHLNIEINYNGGNVKTIIENLKNNPNDLQKLIDFCEKNPIEIIEEPDETYHLTNGHHRATLLFHSGIEMVPAIIKNKGEYIN